MSCERRMGDPLLTGAPARAPNRPISRCLLPSIIITGQPDSLTTNTSIVLTSARHADPSMRRKLLISPGTSPTRCLHASLRFNDPFRSGAQDARVVVQAVCFDEETVSRIPTRVAATVLTLLLPDFLAHLAALLLTALGLRARWHPPCAGQRLRIVSRKSCFGDPNEWFLAIRAADYCHGRRVSREPSCSYLCDKSCSTACRLYM